MSTIRLNSITKIFGPNTVVRNVDLEISSGELFFLLGPSGCGKSTLLRIIAGLETPTTGDVYLDETRITDLPTYKRGIGMVFQQYALWPHLKVRENVAFGLQTKGISNRDSTLRVEEVLEQVHLSGYQERYPHELSGGQQQRVALARALAPRPEVILLDEPLSNLDTRLRDSIRRELAEIHAKLKVTMIYVTHDQEDALALADRVAIMKNGSIRQIGTPYSLYKDPVDNFVGVFMGETNLLSCSMPGSKMEVSLLGNTVPAPRAAPNLQLPQAELFYSVRPEDVVITKEHSLVPTGEITTGIIGYQGLISNITLRGGWRDIEVYLSAQASQNSPRTKLVARMHHGDSANFTQGDQVLCTWAQDAALLLPSTE